MPWLERCAIDERVGFIAEWLAGEASKTELCERYGISRRVGYKWAGRYAAEGPAGLVERSHAPISHGMATAVELVDKIAALRRARPTWGSRKILAKLEQLHPKLDWPSASTVHELLKRKGLIPKRRLRRHPPRRVGDLTEPERPNGQLPPARFYTPSARPMPSRLPQPDYPAPFERRRVKPNGEVKFGGQSIHTSSALAGEGVAFEEIERGRRLWFYNEPIGLLDHRGHKLLPIQPG